MDIRASVVAAMTRQGMTANQLALAVAPHIHRSHVYDYVAGRKELSSDKLNHLLGALGLKIVHARTPSKAQ